MLNKLPKSVSSLMSGVLISLLLLGIGLTSQTVAQDTSAVETEAKAVKASCYSDAGMRNEADCECLAATFKQQRLALGPDVAQGEIVNSINRSGQCLNFPSLQRSAYATCIMLPSLATPDGIEPEQFCQCYSRKVVKILSEHSGKIGHSTKGSANSHASAYCLKKDAYP